MAKTDERAAAAIGLLAAMGKSKEPLSRQDLMAMLDLSSTGLDDAIALVSTLADRQTGARAVVSESDDGLSLIGDAATLKPLRLTLEEGMVLSHVLSGMQIGDAARQRIERAILPLDVADDRSDDIIDESVAGGTYLKFSEAIRYGVRCLVSYRSGGDQTPRERTIDPIHLENRDGSSYLVAWDVERDAQRRYRLDRVESLSFTDDSVDTHPWKREDLDESIQAAGARARLSFASERRAHELGWSGLGRIDARPDGSAEADVSFTSEPWLFDQVLSAGGSIRIVSPDSLRTRLSAYARELLTADAYLSSFMRGGPQG